MKKLIIKTEKGEEFVQVTIVDGKLVASGPGKEEVLSQQEIPGATRVFTPADGDAFLEMLALKYDTGYMEIDLH
ncbi:MAG TPA: hypothetical protein VJA22_02715 [Patescibacteria group bacterium]|nr:hypothetical protein [Patescibacteria group bacterium]